MKLLTIIASLILIVPAILYALWIGLMHWINRTIDKIVNEAEREKE
jgi:hypothetical protein